MGKFSIGVDGTKKPAAPPMTAYERDILLALISENAVVESKKTDFGTQTEKNEAWKKIELSFCSSDNVHPRTSEQLNVYWKNLKQRTKSDVAAQKRSMRKTGGGSPAHPLSSDAIKVCSIIPNQMTSLDNPFDCDGVQETTVDASSTATLSVNTEADDVTEEAPHVAKKSRMETPKSAPRKDTRSFLIELENEEHKLRLQTLRIEFETAKILREKAEAERNAITAEHKVRMDILAAQLEAFSSFPRRNADWNGNPPASFNCSNPSYYNMQ